MKAIKLLNILKKINPENIDARKNLVELFILTKNKNKVMNELKFYKEKFES